VAPPDDLGAPRTSLAPPDPGTSRARAASAAAEPSRAGDDEPASADRIVRRQRSLLLVLLVALFLRGGVLALAWDMEPVNDQIMYTRRAEELLDGKGYLSSYQTWVRHPGERKLAILPQYPGAYQSPGYPAFMALVMFFTGRGTLAVKIVQVLLGTASVWLIYALGRAWFRHSVGLAAAWIYALYPNLVAFTHYLFSETLFIILFLAATLLITRSKERVLAPGPALAAGALMALAAYTKSSVLYFLPFFALWYLVLHRRELAAALLAVALVAVGFGATVAPWALRNHGLHGGLVLIDSSGPYNLWRGNRPGVFSGRRNDRSQMFDPPFHWVPIAPVADVGGRKLADIARIRFDTKEPTDLQVMAVAGEYAWLYVKAEPRDFVRNAGYKLIDMWNPTSFVMRHMKKDSYGELSPLTRHALVALVTLSYLLVMALALWGWRKTWRDANVMLVLLMVGYYSGIHAITFGLTRFRLPLMPFLILLAAVAVVAWRERRAARVVPGPAVRE
jgi:4-amino-4-deoxy-L-arabinose transferase-like glycosyltransferase